MYRLPNVTDNEDDVRRNSSAVRKESCFKAVCAGIQAAAGSALVANTIEDSTYRVLPYMFSAIAADGAYTMFNTLWRNFVKAKSNKRDGIWSIRSLATGTFTYFTGVYAFSESLKRCDKTWIPSLAIAASGFYFASSAIKNMNTVFNRNAFLKSCQVMFGPTLIASATTYLLHFQKHEEKWLFWSPFVITSVIGYEIAHRDFPNDENSRDFKAFLLRGIEQLMSGCSLVISGTVLVVYGLTNKFHPLWTISATVVTVLGVNAIYFSFIWFQRYLDMDQDVFYNIVGMAAGPAVFVVACLLVKFVEDSVFMCLAFPFLTGVSIHLYWASFFAMTSRLPTRQCSIYFLRVMGPQLVLYSCPAAAYIGYRMGWYYSLLMTPVLLYGISFTIVGFGKPIGE